MSKIKITFPDGNIKEFDKGVTGYEIAEGISQGLARETLAVKVNGSVIDLKKPITDDAEIKFLTFKDKDGKEVYWHSTSHLMAHAVQEIYPEAKFGVGPAIDAGFYYANNFDYSVPSLFWDNFTESHVNSHLLESNYLLIKGFAYSFSFTLRYAIL